MIASVEQVARFVSGIGNAEIEWYSGILCSRVGDFKT
mgnify:CR=1 FL=1